MKKKRIAWIAVAGLVTGLIIGSVELIFSKQSKSVSVYDKAGQQIEQFVSDKDSRNVAVGEDIEISLEELKLRGKLQIYSGEKADYDALLDDLIEEKTIYYKAVQEGIQEDENEAEKQVNNMKEMVEEGVSGAEQVQSILDQFENENEYWDYVKERIIIKGTVQKYKEKIQKKTEQKDESAEKEIAAMVSEQNVKINEEMLEKLKTK